MFWNLVLFAVSFVASAILAPKPKLENARAAKLSDLDFPRSDEGAAVPLLLGRGVMRGPNTLWFGDFEAVKITERVRTGLFSRKTVTVGHRYFIGVDLCFALGPVRLHRIKAGDDKVLFEGDLESSVTLNTQAVSLGGHKKGGTLQGQFTFYPGTDFEVRDSYIASKLTPENADILPNYRGFARVVFKRLEVGEAPQMPKLEFEASSYPDPLGLGAINQIGADINPATAIYYLLTQSWGGLGMAGLSIIADDFIAAANTLHAEGHGISLVLGQSDQAREYLDEILRQIDGVIYEDAATRMVGLRLIRDDYDPEAIPSFTDAETLEIVSFTRGLWDVTHNEVRVNYTSPERNYQTATAFAQDAAAISRLGSVRAVEFSFPGVTSATLAQSLAQRELRQVTTPLVKARVIFNRSAAGLRVGDVFKLSNAEYGISGLIMRVERVDSGTLDDGRVAIDATQDIFGVASLVFARPSPGRYVPPATTPEPAAVRAVIEAPRWIVERLVVDGLVADGGASVLVFLAAAPNDYSIGFSVELDGELVASDLAFTDGGVAALPIDENDSQIVVASAPGLAGIVADLRDGGGSIYVNGEWMQYTAATNNGDGTVTLDVIRGRYQTARAAHPQGAAVLLLDHEEPPIEFEARTGSPSVAILPETYSGTLPSAAAPIDVVALVQRNARPNAPEFEAPAPLSPGASGVNLTWRPRSDKGRTDVSLPGDPADPYPAGEYAIAVWSIDGGLKTEVAFGVGATSGNISFGVQSSGAVLTVDLFGATGDGLGANRSIEFDRLVLVIP